MGLFKPNIEKMKAKGDVKGLIKALKDKDWHVGWKAWALLPLGIGYGIAFLIGFIMAALGASRGSIPAMGVVLDVVIIGTLIGMVVKPCRKTQRVESRQASEVTTTEVG